MRIRIPKHIHPDDHSVNADMQRFLHAQEMMHISGGKGFRQPSAKATKKYHKTRYEKMAERCGVAS